MALPAVLAERGFVSIVGAGPGDPDLLTVKALKRLQRAEVVAYDRLVNPEILKVCPHEARLLYVGKHGPCSTSWSQEAINALLVQEASAGHTVVRLKGGDPFVFGRGGEEALALKAAGIPFEIIPGISSAIAAPAYAGIPVTHRGVATSVTIVTGHEDPSKDRSGLDWSALAKGADTLVILMGLGRLESIVQELITHGRAPHMPAAAVHSGTTLEQRTVVATLGTLAEAVRDAGLKAPAALVIGEVVTLRENLAWVTHDLATPPAHPAEAWREAS